MDEDNAKFWGRVKNFVDKGVDASKDLFVKAGERVQDMGEKSVLKVEIFQLKKQLEKQFALLGENAFNAFSKNEEAALSSESEGVKEILTEIKRLNREIEEKNAQPAEEETSENAAAQNKSD